MAPTIEIYDERELCSETLTQEPDAEALALIEELGLKRQVDADSGARVSYPNPTADQGFILSVLFPTATKVDQYDAGCIPLRVLKEIRSYRAENPNHILLVRHSTPAQVRDPVLLAYTKPEHAWMWDQTNNWRDFRLVARWGDALEPWADLMAKAQKVMATSATEALDRIIRKATTMRDSVAATGSWASNRLPELNNIPEGW